MKVTVKGVNSGYVLYKKIKKRLNHYIKTLWMKNYK